MTDIFDQFDTLLVSGCSFSHNYQNTSLTWSHWLYKYGRFKNFIDCTCPGAGNKHIHDAVILALEERQVEPHKILVAIMWSGYDRDDFMVTPESINPRYSNYYQYVEGVNLGLTGSMIGNGGNLILPIENIRKMRNCRTRAFENYLWIIGLHNYLENRGFKFFMTEFHPPNTHKDCNFDPCIYFPDYMSDKFKSMVRRLSPNLGAYSINQGYEGFHPSKAIQKSWHDEILIPWLQKNL